MIPSALKTVSANPWSSVAGRWDSKVDRNVSNVSRVSVCQRRQQLALFLNEPVCSDRWRSLTAAHSTLSDGTVRPCHLVFLSLHDQATIAAAIASFRPMRRREQPIRVAEASQDAWIP